jgi:alpha-tubulin suppressor-like RCC1 family protein
MRVVLLAAALASAGTAGCGCLAGLQNYEDCAETACTPVEDAAVADVTSATDSAVEGGRDASQDSASFVDVPEAADVIDAAPDASLECQTSSQCPTAAPACSQGVDFTGPGHCTAVASLVAGSADSQCVILADGTLWCWGANQAGELGRGAIGSMYSEPAPVSVLPPGSTVTQAGTGFDFACALTSNDHKVYCWGNGTAGSGVGTAAAVQLPTDALELSVGESSACARIVGNDVYCWGQNSYADIGCGPDDAGATTVSLLAPQLLMPASLDIGHVAVGLQASCGATSNSGDVYCYGTGQWGSLGGPSLTPTSCGSSALMDFATNAIGHLVSSDYATCATDINNNIYCWGMNYVFTNAGLIDPDNGAQEFDTPYLLPLPPGGGGSISMGWEHGCLISNGGGVTCWGASTHGETGIYSSSAVPQRQVSGIGGSVAQMVAQRQFTCVLRTDGQVLCWGNNVGTLIGANVGTDTPTPTAIVW